MATQRKNRRKKPDRRSGDDRRTKDVPVEAERRTGERRRTALTRRLELETAADQIHAALGLLTYAQDQGLLLDVDRWLLGTAIARLRVHGAAGRGDGRCGVDICAPSSSRSCCSLDAVSSKKLPRCSGC